MGLAVYDEVVIRVKINGNYGDDFETFLGVKQGDPLVQYKSIWYHD